MGVLRSCKSVIMCLIGLVVYRVFALLMNKLFKGTRYRVIQYLPSEEATDDRRGIKVGANWSTRVTRVWPRMELCCSTFSSFVVHF